MKARVTENDSAKKRKLLKRRRQPTSTDETNSEEFAVPSAKRSYQRRKKETIDACADIHGGTNNNKAPVLDGLWLTLIKEAAPSLANYLSKSKKALNKVVPKVVKEGVAKFEGSFENKLRSVRVLYSNGLLSKEKYKSVCLNMFTCFNSTGNKRSSLMFMHDVTVPKHTQN